MRLLPYSTRPGRLLRQLFSDVAVAIWTTIWVFVGLAVHASVSTIAAVGRQVKDGADGISDNLNSAGDSAHRIPLVGDKVGGPLRAASEAAADLAGAGHNLDTTATWLAVVLAIAVAAPPILAFAGPWIFLRIRFFRRKLVAVQLAATPAGEQLLALRALANRPLKKLAVVTADPVAAWRAEDAAAIRGLAAIELKATGISAPKQWRTPEFRHARLWRTGAIRTRHNTACRRVRRPRRPCAGCRCAGYCGSTPPARPAAPT